MKQLINRRFLATGLALALGAAGLVAITGGTSAPAVAQAATAAAPNAYTVDLVHSSIVWRIKHGNASWFYGLFGEFSGSFNFDPAAPETSKFDIKINPASVYSNNKSRDEHIRGSDFFAVKEFPEMTFAGKSLTKNTDGTFSLSGDLTFRGQTKPVTAKLEHTGAGKNRGGKDTIGFEARFQIKRSDFGNDYMVGKGLSDEVDLIVSIQGAKQ